ncbi:hypothetical protein [Mucilaginibacter terrenus]|nr:hypothetical protein [Mucilaginibacter terrenus]
MSHAPIDTELEAELQEVYLQATLWLQDISFLETETHFFRSLIDRYELAAANGQPRPFEELVSTQQERLQTLKAKIPEFLAFVEPYLGDLKKPMHLDFLNRYNMLQKELSGLFAAVRATKKELFDYTERLLPTSK